MANPPDASFCLCCEPHEPPAPALIFNRPGLGTIAWRTGSYATFRQAMIEAMASGPPNLLDTDDTLWPLQVRNALATLTTRDDSDDAITLIDLFAAVSDVLSFNSERYVNEFFIRTARERDSVLRLARLIGYRLAPGLGATTSLAFTLDPGASTTIRSGLKLMSVPGQDEVAQTFETVGSISADARLNDVPLYGAPQPVVPFQQGLSRIPILQRPETLLRNDTLAIIGNNDLQITSVRALEAASDGEYLAFTTPLAIAGSTSVGFKTKRALRFFGHNVPPSYSFYDTNPAIPAAKRWSTKTVGVDYSPSIPASQTFYPLDARIEDLKPGSLLLVDLGSGAPRYVFALVGTVVQATATLGPMSDTVTWVALSQVAIGSGDNLTPLGGTGLPAIADRRQTRIYELVRPQIVPRRYIYPASFSGGSARIRSDHVNDVRLFTKKQHIAIADGARHHIATIATVEESAPSSDGISHITVGFDPPIGTGMTAPRLNGNVAPASHGETQRDEPLGHGDASALFQRFKLQRKRVTRLPGGVSVTPRAELAVRVNGEPWTEAPSFYGRGPNERIYTLRYDDAGNSIVSFGDGRTGARLPSGAGNVVARYRIGMGLEGRLAAGQLSTLLERPVGVRTVSNPLPTDGGADPETLDTVRDAAPLTVRTFGRAIALSDFADVARQAGMAAAARATWTWMGLEQAIQLTVSGGNGQRLSPDALKALHDTLTNVRDPNHLLIIGNLWRVPIVITTRILRDPAFEKDAVEDAARAALLDFMQFEHQPMGHPLHLSQIVSVLQGARGVAAVDVDLFQIKGFASWTAAQLSRRSATLAAVQPHVRLFDARPRPPAATLDPAALAGLALDPDALALPAEQAFIEKPDADLTLHVVEAL
ncbi:MAG: putative baseplate assembly protein [Methylocella sp.]|nr:MAG: putative baseplate assembly protein [Hyphomicrobiales bacterium]